MNMISAGRKTWCQRIKAAIILEGVILLMAAFILWENTAGTGGKTVTATSDGTIRWVDFNVSYEALCKAYECDVDTYGSEMHIDWIELLSYVAARVHTVKRYYGQSGRLQVWNDKGTAF